MDHIADDPGVVVHQNALPVIQGNQAISDDVATGPEVDAVPAVIAGQAVAHGIGTGTTRIDPIQGIPLGRRILNCAVIDEDNAVAPVQDARAFADFRPSRYLHAV